jgi:hypothetical protein
MSVKSMAKGHMAIIIPIWVGARPMDRKYNVSKGINIKNRLNITDSK